MKEKRGLLQRNLSPFVAILIVIIFYVLSLQPKISKAEREELSKQFSFSQFVLPDEDSPLTRTHREVAPSLEHMKGWFSSTGAGVALNDLDGDGFSNDLCKVDPRTDNVLIATVPNTGERFKSFTLNAGSFVNKTIAPMGCIPNDYNEDGITDILVYYWGRTPLVFLANKTSAEFVPNQENYTVQEVVKSSRRWFTGGATVADLDGDTHLDIVIGNYFQDDAEIIDPESKNLQTLHSSMSRAVNGGKSRILHYRSSVSGENPSVNFEIIEDYIDANTEREKEEITHGWTLSLAACDLDGDLLPELYFGNDFGHDRLLYNISTPGQIRFRTVVGKKEFTTPNSKVVGLDSFKGMGVDFGDVNNDGLFDFYVSNIADEYALEESHLLFLNTGKTEQFAKGIAPYIERSEELGISRSSWGWDTKIADFNNDGQAEILQAVGFLKGDTNRWAELHEVGMGNDQLMSNPNNWHKFEVGDDLSGHDHNPFFVRAKDGRFYDLAFELGLDHPQVSRGIATADVNGDGKLDFAVANQWDTSLFYLNKAENTGEFLGLQLRFPIDEKAKTGVYSERPKFDGSSRPAIGAYISLLMSNGKKQVAFVDGGNGHSGKRSSDVQFGLGKISREENLNIEVRWIDRNGNLKKQDFSVSKGWNTIILGE